MNNKYILALGLATSLFLTSCGDDDSIATDMNIETPATYEFKRDGANTVSFGGQTTRIEMANQILGYMTEEIGLTDKDRLINMFHNVDTPFFTDELNQSSKSVSSKVAASKDYFPTNPGGDVIYYLEDLLENQVDVVAPNLNENASSGVAGQLADGTKTRYVNENGFENNQLFAKTLIGALMVDQALNNYLSPAVLDAGTNVEDNDNGVVASGKTYTTMEHKWDEAFGYVYGLEADPANPVYGSDNFLNKYIGKVDGDSDFAGIADEIFNAFKKGRAAIVAKRYDIRDEQAEIIRENISKVIGVRAVHYLQSAKNALEAGELGSAAHDLSEGIGFVNSLEFTRVPNTTRPYISASQVDDFQDEISDLYSTTSAELDQWSQTIANAFGFTVEQAK